MVTKYRVVQVTKHSGRETHLATTRTEDQAKQAAEQYQKDIPVDIDGIPTATIKIVPVEMKDNQA